MRYEKLQVKEVWELRSGVQFWDIKSAIEFEMYIKHPVMTELVVEDISLEFRVVIWDNDISLGIINIK